MTNNEKYKDPNVRAAKYLEFCDKSQFKESFSTSIACAYAWGDIEYVEEPLPCPFCGGDVMLNREKSDAITTYKFECPICFASISFAEATREKAIEKWNMRD